MSKRIRLTDPRRAASRRPRRAVEDTTPYPGTVNQPERTFKRRDQYDMDWETTNHPYPDMRHEWQDDERDEIGFGIPESDGTNQMPTIASARVAASKAVRVAVLLLGEKVEDDVIEAQAQDLMALGDEGLDRTIQRFVESQDLYAEEKKDDSEEEAAKSMQEKKEEEAKKDKEASAELADSMDDVPAAIAAPAKPAQGDVVSASDDEDEDDEDEGDSKEAADESKEESKDDEGETKEAAEEAKDEAKEESKDEAKEETAAVRGPNEMDIELTSASEMDVGEAEADPRLSSLFEDEDVAAAMAAQAADAGVKPRKAGIKELGGQPRAMTAGDGDAVDLGSIWDTAPDVSGVFR